VLKGEQNILILTIYAVYHDPLPISLFILSFQIRKNS